MHMHIYKAVEVEIEEFVNFWSQRYIYPEQQLYYENIGCELTEERIFNLFLWKNGVRLSERKRNSVQENFIKRRSQLEQFKINTSPREFLEVFREGGAIWRIFWLHCFRPDRFPIYDQHVHRAMAFIQNRVIEEIPQYDPRKIDAYIDRYIPFYEKFAMVGPRNLDKALWSFGKFIKETNFPECA